MRALLSIWLVFTLLGLKAQEIKVEVSSNQLAVGQRFQITYSTEKKGSNFKSPDLSDFAVLSGPNKMSNMQLVNGQFSSSISYSFIAQAVSEGEFEIEPARMKIGSDWIESKPVKITVKGHRTKNTQQKQSQKSKQKNQAPKASATQADLEKNAFIKLYVDKKNVFVGEQLTATYILYFNQDISNHEVRESPVFNGFYEENIELDNNNLRVENINGKKYKAATLKKVLLTAQKSGEIEIPPFELELELLIPVRKKRQSIFDMAFGNYQRARMVATSNSETVEVTPLPTFDQPKSFTGAVGQFNLSHTLDRTEIAVNEAVNLTVKIEGSGNIDLVGLPDIVFPGDFEVYDPKTKQNIKTNASGSSGWKTYEYVIIPRYAGTFELDPVEIAYFDPKTKKYKTITTGKVQLNVLKEDGTTNNNQSAFISPRKEDVQVIGTDIRYIHTSAPTFEREQTGFFNSIGFYGLSTLPFAGLGAVLLFVGFRRKRLSDEAGVKSRRAGKVARKHLSKAQKLLDKDDDVAFFDAISSALFGYLSDKLQIAVGDLNRDVIEQALAEASVGDTLRLELKKMLDECDMVRFAPGVVRSKAEMLSSSEKLIESLEDVL